MAKTANPKHRMKRPQPPDAKAGRHVHDIKQAYTNEQLIEVGAIALTWNQIDFQIDFLLLVVLKMPIGLWLEVTKRINGMDGKIEILRLRSNQSSILTNEAKSTIKLSLDAVAEYKKYRDAIVHSIPFDIDRGIAQRIGSRAETTQILLTIEALRGLYDRLVILRDELGQIDLLYRLTDEKGAAAIYQHADDPRRLRRTRDVPTATALAQKIQNQRLSLRPLPEFPD